MMTRLVPFLCVALAAGLFFAYINPTRTGSITDSRAQIASYESALAAADRFSRKQGELVVARANIPSEGLARLESFLPDGVDNVQIILDLTALAARSGITLSDFDTTESASATGAAGSAPQGGAAPATASGAVGAGASGGLPFESVDPIDSIDLTVSATGTYASFHAFLEGIEQSLRLLDVVSISVSDSETGVYTYDMTIRLYWLH
jgi:hypothetical protein